MNVCKYLQRLEELEDMIKSLKSDIISSDNIIEYSKRTYKEIFEFLYETQKTVDIYYLSKSRQLDKVMYRTAICFILKNNTKLTYVQIGTIFTTDHSTAIECIQRHNRFMYCDDTKYIKIYTLINSKLTKFLYE